MPDFDDEIRTALFEEGILTLDEDGRDVFTGLTLAETKFMLSYELPANALRDAEARLFQQLHEKFLAAREAARSRASNVVILQLERHRIRPGRSK